MHDDAPANGDTDPMGQIEHFDDPVVFEYVHAVHDKHSSPSTEE